MSFTFAPGLKKFIKDNNISIIKRDNKIEYLILYKVVTKSFSPWWLHHARNKHSGIYRPGTSVTCKEWDSHRYNTCGKGLHIGTLDFCTEFAGMNRPYIVEVLVRPEDVVCVPIDSNGKIRCNRLLVTRLLGEYYNGSLWRKKLSNGKWSELVNTKTLRYGLDDIVYI